MKIKTKLNLNLNLLIITTLIHVYSSFADDKVGETKLKSHDDLLLAITQERISENIELREREAQFIKKKTEKNEKILSAEESQLNLAKGVLGELFGVVRQYAGDFRGKIESSLISIQLKDRTSFLNNLTENKILPTINELEKFWLELGKEMVESGKISQFNSSVVQPNGEIEKQNITRIGTFNILSSGKYLTYQSETEQVQILPRQPHRKFLSLVSNFEEEAMKARNSSGKLEDPTSIGVDPSRGAILSMIVETPGLFERIEQGGTVGFVIILVLVLGMIIVGERFFSLTKEMKKVNLQMKKKEIDETNFLGRLLKVYREYGHFDLKTLEMKLEESIIKSIPKVERGIPTIKILAGVAPLLGLLGTVTGMISTFQSITLFGAGDPKLMAGGISTALVTTVLGLVCAIPLLILHNLISGKSKELIHILEEESAGILAIKAEQEGGVI